jgi:hypothetical protein
MPTRDHSAMRMSGCNSVAIFELLLGHIHGCVGGLKNDHGIHSGIGR